MTFIKKYALYLVRWQLSTPTLAVFSSLTVSYITGEPLRWASGPEWAGAMVANLIGGAGFYFIDRMIFKK